MGEDPLNLFYRPCRCLREYRRRHEQTWAAQNTVKQEIYPTFDVDKGRRNEIAESKYEGENLSRDRSRMLEPLDHQVQMST
jgi:hypothetical protein